MADANNSNRTPSSGTSGRSNITIRPATSADALPIASVHYHSWLEAYAGRIPQALLDSMTLSHREAQWQNSLSGDTYSFPWADGDVTCLVAETSPPVTDQPQSDDFPQPNGTSAGAVVGFILAGAPREAADRAVVGSEGKEVYALYVRQSHYGTGAGRALMAAAVGEEACMLWVLDDNPRAQGFYRKLGFEVDESEEGTKVAKGFKGATIDIVEKRMVR